MYILLDACWLRIGVNVTNQTCFLVPPYSHGLGLSTASWAICRSINHISRDAENGIEKTPLSPTIFTYILMYFLYILHSTYVSISKLSELW